MTILSNNKTENHTLLNFLSNITRNHDLLVSPDSIDNYSSLIENLDSSLREIALKSLQEKFESLDQMFFDSMVRKRDYNVKSKRSRTILTIFGQITYTRRIYQSKSTGKYYIYVDRKLGIPKYDKYDPTIKGKICELYINIGSMLKVGEVVGEQMHCSFSTKQERKNYNISRQTVYNILKSTHRLQPQIDRRSNTPDLLYIMADEKFIPTQTEMKSKVMVRHAVLFEGFKKVSNRNTLTNKLHFTSLDRDFWEQFHDFIAGVYDLSKVKKIILMGDGASWIKAGAKELLNSKFYLDKFHTFQAINLMTKNPILQPHLRQSLIADDIALFEDLSEVLLTLNSDDPSRLESIKEKRNYILRHWEAIQRTLKSDLRCPMESHISHNIASIFTSRPKAFKVDNLKRYISLRDLFLNNVDIQDAYLKTIHFSKTDTLQPIKKEVLDFSMFEPKSNYDKSSTSNWVKGFISKN